MPVLETIDVANDDFIRTTEQRHLDGAKAFWQDLYDRGAVYKGEFSGYYSVGSEEFVGDDDVVDGEGDDEGFKVSALDGSRLEHMTEENYFFKLSEYQQPLLDYYDAHPDFIQPASARNEIVAFVRRGLNDLSMSRSTFDWGIQVPWDTNARHVRLDRGAAQLRHRGRVRHRRGASSSGSGRPTSTSSARTSPASTPSSGRRC